MASNQLLDNRYQIINKLHETDLSITFQGQDTRRFNRLCLIKQLKTCYKLQLQQELEKRFQQEAKILERLGNHPQIPDLYGYFSENNQLYLVQEWIAGCNLKQNFDQEGKLTETALKDILIKLLPVIEFLKENQIVHRDIKPSNIMLNGENLPILIDFGIVKEIYTIVNQNIAYTVAGIGTPGLTSPEQKKVNLLDRFS
ncbi:MAG: serine/threonine protein kinase [Okeania sp. SIO3I5]|uniref:serine/threonine protein kinase n=1 Tax=Okeania sp. SIO3I5 TaxID=2607805 RepID=UPI0013BAD1F0|nr:serine/threonine-protein kinase [Okeania sp. SIO3I5]NEQ36856.1 serine/threonine protein kinase [Okeania sp. SIO3I5]